MPAAPQPRKCYVVQPPQLEVMFEQLAYLAAHRTAACDSYCPDCVRLEQVQDLLLSPFNEKMEA